MQIGDLKLRSVVAARFRFPADVGPHPEVEVVARLLVVDGPDGRTLVDTGPGGPDRLTRVLAEEGIGVDSIDRLILTHLHWDHAGGAPLFGKPTHLHRLNLIPAAATNGQTRRGYRREDVERIAAEAAILATATEPRAQIASGIRVTVSSGHTQGMQIVWIEGGGETVIATGDLIPTLSHLRLPGSGEYDADPGLLEREKREVIEEALRRNAWLFFYHDRRRVAVRLGGTPERPVAVEEVRF